MTHVNQDKSSLYFKINWLKESDTISLHEQTRERKNKISFLRLFVLSRCTSRQNEEMEFHFFVCSFCRVVQVAKTKKWNFISSFARLVAFPKARQTTKLPRNIKVWFVVVTSSFCRLFVLSTSTRRQNDRTTTRQNEFLRPFRFVVCLICRVIQVAKTKKWNFILAFVHFVAFHKAPKRTNEMAVSGFHTSDLHRAIIFSIHISNTAQC